LIVCALFFSLLAIAEIWSRLGHAKPESTRKLVHIGGGVIGLSLPWLLNSPLVVFVLTVSLSAIFLAGGKTGLLKSLHGVERKSRGSEYYPLAIFLIFLLAADRPWLYLTAVIVLAVADAFAALIGIRYGRLRYEIEGEYKSVEGSTVFFVIAFLAILLPALLMTNMPRAVCVLSALLVAMLVTLFEAISLEGTDNIFVPIAVVFVMQKITTKPASEIVYQNVSLLLIVAIVALLTWRYHWFNPGGALTFILFIFATWSLGSRRWSAPVFIALIAVIVIRQWIASRAEHPMKVRMLLRAVLVPFLFLATANFTGRYDLFYGPYITVIAATLSFLLWVGGVRLRVFAGWNRIVAAGALGFLCALGVSLPMWILFRTTSLNAIAVILVVVAIISVTNALMLGTESAPFLLATLAGALVLALQLLGAVPSWRSRRTVPALPSIVTMSPVFTSDVMPRIPTMVGMPISRATIAECERIDPRSMISPEIDG
jgi:phytol kinase